MDVRIEPAASDHVATRRRHDRTTVARKQRPREQEGGTDLARERVVDLVAHVAGVHPHLVGSDPVGIGAERDEQPQHRLDVSDPRHVLERDLLVGEQARRQDRQGAVLVAGGAHAARERMAALDHERFRGRSDDGRGHEANYARCAMAVTRDQAWTTLTSYTKSEALLRHALAVEASTASYAARFGEDEELWRVTALLHDFDYEIHPTLDKHPQDGAQILRDEGYPDVVIDGVLSHANHLSLPRDTPLKKSLFACDELSGFVHACGLVRPTGLEGLEPKSVKKKLKQPSFAAGVSRDDVYEGALLLELELDEHIANVVAALQPIAGELGLQVSSSTGA